jgi:hypothetical protein
MAQIEITPEEKAWLAQQVAEARMRRLMQKSAKPLELAAASEAVNKAQRVLDEAQDAADNGAQN